MSCRATGGLLGDPHLAGRDLPGQAIVAGRSVLRNEREVGGSRVAHGDGTDRQRL